jgi:ribosomal protein L11 methyltransferase
VADRLVRWRLKVPAEEAELALSAMLAAFPAGVEEEGAGDQVAIAGYAAPGWTPPAGLALTPEPVADGWAEAWRAFHRPVRVGRFWIGPPWLEPDAGSAAVVIEPGRAFGTGAHGSTRAAAELLLRLPPGGAIGDVGCGSGVLAVLAARLGFAPVLACDVDPLAVAATLENAARNDVAVTAHRADALIDPLPDAPVLVANIQLDVLAPFLDRPDLPDRIVVSGLLAPEDLVPAGWRAAERAEVDGWRAIRLER